MPNPNSHADLEHPTFADFQNLAETGWPFAVATRRGVPGAGARPRAGQGLSFIIRHLTDIADRLIELPRISHGSHCRLGQAPLIEHAQGLGILWWYIRSFELKIAHGLRS
jgi:hypothetical protein